MVLATNTAARQMPRILDTLCNACPRCEARAVCRTKALVQIDPGEPPAVDVALCYGCHACVPACPFGAIVAG